jgi:N-methylhydantoinase B
VQDSEGAGEFRGAPAVRVELGPVADCALRIFFTADGTLNPAAGARGGGSGGNIQALKRTPSGNLEPQPACGGVALAPGESIVSVSAGGGGYGPPTARAAERVAHDVAEGWVSRARAAQVYGVILDEGGAVDPNATLARRAALAERS